MCLSAYIFMGIKLGMGTKKELKWFTFFKMTNEPRACLSYLRGIYPDTSSKAKPIVKF